MCIRDSSRPHHFPEAEAMLKYDDNYIYVIFKVKDQYVRAVAKEINGKVWQDSCVEFFFTPGPDTLRGYFNLEVNCKGIFLFEYHTNNGSKAGFVDNKDYSKILVSHSLDIDVVQELDWSVGEILKKVEEYGLTENTLIVFTSDNGPWLAMKEFGGSAGILRGGKFFTFEGGMRVPAVAMWKGVVPSGQVTSDMVSMMDWMPTIMDVTGGKPTVDRVIDGKNIMDLLSCTGKRASNSYLYIYLDELRGYRENDWKVKLPFEGFGGARWKVAVAPHDTLLFNLKTDPGEKTDLFSENPEKAWELCCRMDSAYKSLGDLPPSLIMNSPADKSHFERMKQ